MAIPSKEKKNFINDNNYKNSNETNKDQIDSLIKEFEERFEEKCIKKFYPKWRGDEGGTKVFVFKLYDKLMSKYHSKRENIITVRIRSNHLDIEVYNGEYCKGKEFTYRNNPDAEDLIKLYVDINDLFNTNLMGL